MRSLPFAHHFLYISLAEQQYQHGGGRGERKELYSSYQTQLLVEKQYVPFFFPGLIMEFACKSHTEGQLSTPRLTCETSHTWHIWKELYYKFRFYYSMKLCTYLHFLALVPLFLPSISPTFPNSPQYPDIFHYCAFQHFPTEFTTAPAVHDSFWEIVQETWLFAMIFKIFFKVHCLTLS